MRTSIMQWRTRLRDYDIVHKSLINHLADRDQASIASTREREHGSNTRKELRENEYTWLTLAYAGIDGFAVSRCFFPAFIFGS